MTNKPENPPAFPGKYVGAYFAPTLPTGEPDFAKMEQIVSESKGLTLRDHFAGLAMQAMLAAPRTYLLRGEKAHIDVLAYTIADAMLRERVK